MNSSIRQLLIAQCLTDFKSKFYRFQTGYYPNFFFLQESYKGRESIKYLWMQYALFMYNKVRRIKSLHCSNIDYSSAQHGNEKMITDLYFFFFFSKAYAVIETRQEKKRTWFWGYYLQIGMMKCQSICISFFLFPLTNHTKKKRQYFLISILVTLFSEVLKCVAISRKKKWRTPERNRLVLIKEEESEIWAEKGEIHPWKRVDT